MIAVLDYGVGNVASVKNMIEYLGGKVCIAKSKEDLAEARKIILPGVGGFDRGMTSLRNSPMFDELITKVFVEKVPIMGICLGAQMMCQSSDEGFEKGLGWFDAHVESLEKKVSTEKFKVPHMGWNSIIVKNKNELTAEFNGNERFYFVHSYYMKSDIDSDVFLTTNYGFNFACGLHRENIFALQFHPEKSHVFGMKIIKNFLYNVK